MKLLQKKLFSIDPQLEKVHHINFNLTKFSISRNLVLLFVVANVIVDDGNNDDDADEFLVQEAPKDNLDLDTENTNVDVNVSSNFLFNNIHRNSCYHSGHTNFYEHCDLTKKYVGISTYYLMHNCRILLLKMVIMVLWCNKF